MSLKAIHVSEVPSLDHSLCSSRFLPGGVELSKAESFKIPKFLVVGHRGHGMNMSQSPDPRFSALKENSILSFNAASKLPLDFIEFDVQVSFSFSLSWNPSLFSMFGVGSLLFFWFLHVTAGHTTCGLIL